MNKLAHLGGTPARQKPFPSWPVYDESEERALLEVLRSGQWWSGNQSYQNANEEKPLSKAMAFEREFAAFHGVGYGLACSSGTAALELALKAAGVGPGDEVIVPPYTFLATASAPLLLGAIPVFCDIQPETLNLNPERLEEAITPRTKAIIPVHFAGLAADMERIIAIARPRGIFVLEDAAHGHGGSSRGRRLGALADASIFSFQASKNMTAGEGGIVLTDDAEIAELCNSYLWAGRKVGRPWYEHFRLGWNYRITEFQAAILIEQLRRLPEQTARRVQNGLRLSELLREVPGIEPLAIPEWVTEHAFHVYIFRLDAQRFGLDREQFLELLQAEGVPCSGGYSQPLYRNPMFVENNFHSNGHPLAPSGQYLDYLQYRDKCPIAERACKEMVWIEHRVLLGDLEDMEDVARAIQKIYAFQHEIKGVKA
ncbi:MAG: DegT/DnrJ/EryC1/StrS family aminotransferase [Alloacidobacterium sp.]|jgi:dTDP-4-amino-4,6-dideoxygalactose transaminase